VLYKSSNDLTGHKFGDLTVLGYVVKMRGKKRRGKWECRCSCGKIVDVSTSNLKSGNSTSCGCKFLLSKKYNFIDLTGKKFGSLAVISRDEEFTKTRGVLWLCKCDCGKIVKLPSNSLTSGNTLTCGNKIAHPWAKRIGEIPLSHLSSIKQNAIKRNLCFTVSEEFLWDLFLKQNRRCSLSGELLVFTKGSYPSGSRSETTASLDRIDSSKGYEEGNVTWVHKDLNRMKWELSREVFLEWCRKCVKEEDGKKGGSG